MRSNTDGDWCCRGCTECECSECCEDKPPYFNLADAYAELTGSFTTSPWSQLLGCDDLCSGIVGRHDFMNLPLGMDYCQPCGTLTPDFCKQSVCVLSIFGDIFNQWKVAIARQGCFWTIRAAILIATDVPGGNGVIVYGNRATVPIPGGSCGPSAYTLDYCFPPFSHAPSPNFGDPTPIVTTPGPFDDGWISQKFQVGQPVFFNDCEFGGFPGFPTASPFDNSPAQCSPDEVSICVKLTPGLCNTPTQPLIGPGDQLESLANDFGFIL